MIDSHCHLDHEPLFSNLNQVLLRSKEIGIEKILTICTTKESFKNILNIIQSDAMIYGTFGIHPHESSKDICFKISSFVKIFLLVSCGCIPKVPYIMVSV